MKRKFFQVLLFLLDGLDYLIDSYNLWRLGYCRCWTGEWVLTKNDQSFPSRSEAVARMKLQFESEDVAEALKSQGTNFSGRSRNAPCPCGSGRKFKKCCMGRGEDF